MLEIALIYISVCAVIGGLYIIINYLSHSKNNHKDGK